MINEKSIWLFLRRALYSLKRHYGVRVEIHQLQEADTKYQTGQKSTTTVVHPVERAIKLPEEIARQVEQGIAHLSANKMFVSQAGFDLGKATFIFDARDLPDGFSFGLDDHIFVDDGFAGEYYKAATAAKAATATMLAKPSLRTT